MRGAWIDGGALFALLFLCYAYTFPRWADWNQNSRFDLVVAIVDHGTLSIDCCVANTGDYAVFDGRTYSDKAPGLSFLAVPTYLLFKAIAHLPPVESRLLGLSQGEALRDTLRQGGSGLLLEKIRFALALTFATVLTVALPSALAGVAFYFFLARVTPRRGVRLAVTLAWALATSAFAYSGSFYAHQLVAALLFIAFYLASGAPRAAELVAVGFILGYAVISEYPAALIAAPVAALAWWRAAEKGAVLWTAIGAAVPLLLAAAYNWAIFATPLPVGYRYSALWQQQHATGFLSFTYPSAAALWGLTFSRFRGLFLLSPVLLFALPGFGLLWRSHRAEVAVSAWAVLAFLFFFASSAMWWGGFAVGPRYLVPMLPFLAWPAAAVLARASRWTLASFALLFAVSLVLVWGLTLAEQQFPPDGIAFPWRDWAWPNLARGNLARNAGTMVGLRGYASLAPLAAGAGLIGITWYCLRERR